MSRYALIMVIVFLGLALGVMLIRFNEMDPTVTATQASNDRLGTMRALLETQLADDIEMTFSFTMPIAPGQDSRVVTTSSDMYAGDDYVCFVETWNDDLRHRCTPMSNIASVTFLEQR
jgi:hypothetical protein